MTYIPGDCFTLFWGKARRVTLGDTGAVTLSNDLRDNNGDAVLFCRVITGTGNNPLNIYYT